MLHFRIFNFQVHVQIWFWLTLGLIGGGLRANDTHSMLAVLMFVLAGFISILVHELGHAFMIRKFGLPTEIHLVAFGGFATFPSGRLGRKESFIVTAAGPAVQFVLGLIALALLMTLPIPEGSLMLSLLGALLWVSIAWSVLNCLPIFPLDGGQMLSAILGPQRQHTTYLVGMIVSLVIGALAFLLFGLLLLTLFMGYFAYQNWQSYQSAKG
jgi:Zn-dependent protease